MGGSLTFYTLQMAYNGPFRSLLFGPFYIFILVFFLKPPHPEIEPFFFHFWNHTIMYSSTLFSIQIVPTKITPVLSVTLYFISGVTNYVQRYIVVNGNSFDLDFSRLSRPKPMFLFHFREGQEL